MLLQPRVKIVRAANIIISVFTQKNINTIFHQNTKDIKNTKWWR